MHMTLYDLRLVTNASVAIKIYTYGTFELYRDYMCVDDVPDDLDDLEVTDIFTEGNALCIELDFGEEVEE
jgi:hypothetical protein